MEPMATQVLTMSGRPKPTPGSRTAIRHRGTGEPPLRRQAAGRNLRLVFHFTVTAQMTRETGPLERSPQAVILSRRPHMRPAYGRENWPRAKRAKRAKPA